MPAALIPILLPYCHFSEPPDAFKVRPDVRRVHSHPEQLPLEREPEFCRNDEAMTVNLFRAPSFVGTGMNRKDSPLT